MSRDPVYVGRKFTIRCLELGDGSCPVGDFLDRLDKADRAKMANLFVRLGDHGLITNEEKFKKVENSDKIFEFKSYQIRVFCFYHRKEVILTNAVRKKQDKHKPADVARAEALRRWFLSQLGGDDE